jgi:hypothetical protein
MAREAQAGARRRDRNRREALVAEELRVHFAIVLIGLKQQDADSLVVHSGTHW